MDSKVTSFKKNKTKKNIYPFKIYTKPGYKRKTLCSSCLIVHDINKIKWSFGKIKGIERKKSVRNFRLMPQLLELLLPFLL